MAHLQKGMEEQYEDIAKVSDMLRKARSVKEVEGIWNKFIDQNWRGKEFHSKVGGVTNLTLHANYAATPELARIFSELNDDLRNRISEGRKTPGLENATADLFEKSEIKKSVGDFLKQDLLINELKATDALLKIRYGGFSPEDTAEVVRRLVDEYYNKKQPAHLEGLIRSINANLASEYQELRGKLDSQATFRSMNLA